MAQRSQFVVRADDVGIRLDQLLARHIPNLSRRKARVLLDLGGVFVDGQRTKVASRKLRRGQAVSAVIGGALERATQAVGIRARNQDDARLPDVPIVFEDDQIVVVDKPAGLLTAETPEGDRGNLAEKLRRRQGGGSIFVVHRLDRVTSGLLVLAKTRLAARRLSRMFHEHCGERAYVAIVHGHWPLELKRIESPIVNKSAVSHFEVTGYVGEDASIVKVRLETGRTHQIRIHCASVGHSIIGDSRYLSGSLSKEKNLPHTKRLLLHAVKLGLLHPISSEWHRFESPLPRSLQHFIQRGFTS